LQRFDREIERKLDTALCVIVVWSRHSIESDWVRNEAEVGKERNMLVPARKNNRTATVFEALVKQSHKLPTELYKSLTWDRGSELSNHKQFTLATDIQMYFCDPKSPWQRGSNENTNGLLRQYFPKGTDRSVHTQAKLNAVA
jgi:IS30 family transposase